MKYLTIQKKLMRDLYNGTIIQLREYDGYSYILHIDDTVYIIPKYIMMLDPNKFWLTKSNGFIDTLREIENEVYSKYERVTEIEEISYNDKTILKLQSKNHTCFSDKKSLKYFTNEEIWTSHDTGIIALMNQGELRGVTLRI